MKLRPLHDWVVISRSSLPGNTIWTPDKPSNKGTVLAVGPKVREILIGNEVQFNPYAGLDITVNGETFLFLNEAEISIILR